MKTTRTLVGFLVGLVALGKVPAPACSFRTPMWEVIRQAELIALARIEAFEPADRSGGPAVAGSDENAFESDVAVLKILETWKGSLRGAVRVAFSQSLWANGRRLAVGDRILVFLESGEGQIRQRHEAAMAADEEGAAELLAAYSSRIAIEGSRRAARRAGNRLPRRVMARERAMAAAKVGTSPGLTPARSACMALPAA
jgi:hypothetical protein